MRKTCAGVLSCTAFLGVFTRGSSQAADNYGLPAGYTLGKPSPFTQAYLDEVAFPMTRDALQRAWWDHGTGIVGVYGGVALMR